VPEGDVLFRTAVTMQRWLAGREVTGATATAERVPASRLVGRRVTSVDAFGKHLLIRFDGGGVLHSHMRMTGSWHVYRQGEAWRRPASQARLVLTCGDRVAVCFNAPVIELLAAKAERVHPALSRLGPDILDDPVDLEEVRTRARRKPADVAIGELLLDQTVTAGIGNIWRCEAMFVERRNPWTAQSDLDDAQLDALVSTASRLIRASAVAGTPAPSPRWVYRRQGRPCRRCGTRIEARRQGEQARTAYWCPSCQPATV
jgi:endonuclease-8